MKWPGTIEYNQAIQNLRTSVVDEELRGGELTREGRLPVKWVGGAGVVYQVSCPQTGNTWAVKCFTSEVGGRHDRYRAIAAHVAQADLPFMVDFQYLEQGICVWGAWCPVVKMRWIEGLALNQFVAEHLDRPWNLKRLLWSWLKMSVRLREAGVAHADLQHGNVLLVPQEDGQFALRLIDYDGMYVPALAGTLPGEVGHPAFQHPQRLTLRTYDAGVDRFSHLAIYTALYCLTLGGRELWDLGDNGNNLLFRESDFQNPAGSEVLKSLSALRDPVARALVGRLILACQRPEEQTPWLHEVVLDDARAMGRAEQIEVESLMGKAWALPPELFPPGLAPAQTPPSGPPTLFPADVPHEEPIGSDAPLPEAWADEEEAVEFPWLPYPQPQGRVVAPVSDPVRTNLRRLLRWAVMVFLGAWIWWLTAAGVHAVGLLIVLPLVPSARQGPAPRPSFEEVEIATHETRKEDGQIEKFEVGDTPLEPTELSTETLTLEPPGQIEQTAQYNDESEIFTERGGGVVATASQPQLGGLGGFDVKGFGPGAAVKGLGGDGIGFGGRGTGRREMMLGRFGGTRRTELAVAAALNWFARHQSSDGRWSLTAYREKCTDKTCTGEGDGRASGVRPVVVTITDKDGRETILSSGATSADVAGTALGLLPFLAAGQTHLSNGPYRQNIYRALFWLIAKQKENGDLRGGGNMYSHGLAAIALCEAYGMTGDKTVGTAAQKAIKYIESCAAPDYGRMRYTPGDEGDTSVVGWQVMALKSGQMAGLHVNPAAFEGAKKWLESCASGGYQNEEFSYLPQGKGRHGTDTMTSVGLLCCQYLGAKRGDARMTAGATYLMNHIPDAKTKNNYYWYYATQVMHNFIGPQWDTWNRAMRKILIESQIKDGCAAASWDPAGDKWGKEGGRIMVTSLAALTLEVYYRYLPLYKLDDEEKGAGKAPPDKGAAR